MSTATRVRLGKSELQVSPVCFGTWQLSPRFWGNQDEKQIIAAVRRGFDLGVNFFDTADAYGEGHAESVLGSAIQGLPRDQLVIATKVFWHFYDDGHRHPDLSRDYILAECDASLRRMKLDYIDLYQCHSFDPLSHPAEIVEAMESLMKQGKIRAYGTSNWNAEQMRLGNTFGRFSTCQPQYSLLKRAAEEEVLPYCLANDVGVLCYSSLHLGLLSGKYTGSEKFDDLRKNNPDFQGERFRTICQRVSQVTQIAREHGMSTVQLMLSVTLTHPGITCAIVGIKRPEQIEDAAAATAKRIDREILFKVRSLLSV